VGAGAPPTSLVFERLDVHLAAAPESTYTFTPATALDWDDYTRIIVQTSGLTTAALALQMQLNGIVISYFSQRLRSAAAALTALQQSNVAFWEILSSTALNAASRQFITITEIMLNDPAFANEGFLCLMKGEALLTHEQGGGYNDENNVGPIDSITTFTSASTWAAGTLISTYGVRRINA